MIRRPRPVALAAGLLLLAGCTSTDPAPEPTDASVVTCPRTAPGPDGPGERLVSGADYFVGVPGMNARWTPVVTGSPDAPEACAVEVGTDLAPDGVLEVGETLTVDDEGTTVTLLTIQENAAYVPLKPGEVGGYEPTEAVYRLTYPTPPVTGCAERAEPPTGTAGQVLTRTIDAQGAGPRSMLTSDGCGVSLVGRGDVSWLRVGQTGVGMGILVTDAADDLLPLGCALLSVDLTADPDVLELRVWVPDAG